jgi:hypothetical protein
MLILVYSISETPLVASLGPLVIEELIANIRSYLRSRQKQPNIVKHYFQEEHVRYAGT